MTEKSCDRKIKCRQRDLLDFSVTKSFGRVATVVVEPQNRCQHDGVIVDIQTNITLLALEPVLRLERMVTSVSGTSSVSRQFPRGQLSLRRLNRQVNTLPLQLAWTGIRIQSCQICSETISLPDLRKLPNFVSDPAHLYTEQHTSFPCSQNRQKAAFSGVKRLLREIP